MGGFHSFKDYAASGTLIEQWNGKNWKIISSPNATTQGDWLAAVAAVSGSDVWAVGDAGGRTLTEHWNGTSWSIVSSPNASEAGNVLNGVVAISASDVWAVGNSSDGVNRRTLIEHWDGTGWAIVPSPNASPADNVLNAAAAVSAGNIWAAGSFFAPSGDHETLVEQWNGASWSVVGSPNPVSATSSVLSGVAAVSAGNVWAVGDLNAGQYTGSTLTEHWNGVSWDVVDSPNPGPGMNGLRAVAALPSGDVWAVGHAGQSQTLILHTTS